MNKTRRAAHTLKGDSVTMGYVVRHTLPDNSGLFIQGLGVYHHPFQPRDTPP
jgi:hypothetical protein